MEKVTSIKTANIVTPKDGDLIPFEIKEITKGTLSELLDKETVDKWDHSNPSDPFILITCSNKDYGIMTKLIPLPVDEKGNEDMSKLNFRHTLAQIKNRYKQDLSIGMKITFRYNSEGRTFKMVV